MELHSPLPFLFAVIILCSIYECCSSSQEEQTTSQSSIIFTTLGRSSYSFDIYTLPLPLLPSNSNPSNTLRKKELKLTDGVSVNFNGYFPSSPPSTLFSQTLNQTTLIRQIVPPSSLDLVYVTERNGTSTIYYDSVSGSDPDPPGLPGRRSRSTLELELELQRRVQLPLVPGDPNRKETSQGQVSMKDRPILVGGGEELIYVSTHQDPGVPRASWAAVYSTHLETGSTRRLTPSDAADFSPAVSPSGLRVAVASYGEGSRWDGDVQELKTDIYVFAARDGSGRIKVVEHGGWPTWADDRTIYFHRRSDEDGWWAVYRATLPEENRVGSVVVERVTPAGVHAFTPAAAPEDLSFIAVATRRPGSDYRHIELYDLERNEFMEVTRLVSPHSHHFNPFLSSDGKRVGYHRCREGDSTHSKHIFLENLRHPRSDISLFRVDGSFPSFSANGDRIAYAGFPGLYVANSDGSDRREVYKGTAFSTAWDPIRTGVVYTSIGPTFASEGTKVDIISIDVDADDLDYRKLTTGGENNAFPSPSPDGKWVVFRSGRSGHKNLYIMDALEGEAGYIRRLTDGPWTDTMCNWSPDGEWIAFASDRENPGSGSFAIFFIRPNATDLRKVVQSGPDGGRVNHPWFSPDGKSLVFTSDHAGVSAEPISNPHHYQPYGDIFITSLESDGLSYHFERLTHNSYEDGTPTWGPSYMRPVDVALPRQGDGCDFDDCHWLNSIAREASGQC